MEAIDKSSKPETNIYSEAGGIAIPISAPGRNYCPQQGASSIVNFSGTSMSEGRASKAKRGDGIEAQQPHRERGPARHESVATSVKSAEQTFFPLLSTFLHPKLQATMLTRYV